MTVKLAGWPVSSGSRFTPPVRVRAPAALITTVPEAAVGEKAPNDRLAALLIWRGWSRVTVTGSEPVPTRFGVTVVSFAWTVT